MHGVWLRDDKRSDYFLKFITEKEIIEQTIFALSESPKIKQRYLSEIERLKKRLAETKQNKYRVGVIGVTSSGKSTMINAVLGEKLLCMDVRASSSQLVTCSASENMEKKATIYFNNDRPPEVLTNSRCTSAEIVRYSSELVNNNNHEAVKALELSVPTYDFPSELILIDSPGLDAYNLEAHEKLTMENLLPMMDFCIFVTTMKTNSDEKMRSVLDTIAEYNVPLIIVQNMLDSVQPSIDGKKTKQMVAQEHKMRVERIIQHSAIADKSSVRIVQISAVNALEQRVSRRPDQKKLQESNYCKLIEQVMDVLEQTRPRIESNRLSSVRAELQRLIDDGRKDSAGMSSAIVEKFPFEGLDKDLENQYKRISNNIAAQLNKLNVNGKSSEAKKLRQLVEDPQINDSTLTEIRRIINNCVNSMLDSCKDFNLLIRKDAKKLNLDIRNIMSISSFGAIGGTLSVQMTSKSERVKKSGLHNSIARFFGGIFDTDWGYEYVESKVVDVKSTQQKALEYVGDAQRSCRRTLEEWYKSSEKKIAEILNEIALKRKAYNERMNAVITSAELNDIINKLERIASGIVNVKPDRNSSVKKTLTDISYEQSTITLTSEQYEKVRDIHEKAVNINMEIHYAVHDMIRKSFSATGNFMIIGWDALSMSSYIQRSFGQVIDEDVIIKNAGKNVNCGGFTYCFCPSDNSGSSNCSCLAILTNAIQISQSLKQINDCGILKKPNNWKSVFLVLQDMTEVINGNAVKDAVNAMLSVPSQLNIKCPSLVLINAPNIVYNFTAVQAQLLKTATDADIVDIIDTARKSFGAFCDPLTEKTASLIVKTIFDIKKNGQ